MPRPRILDMDSHKFSMDLHGNNKKIIDEMAGQYELKYGPLLNHIIQSICIMPPHMKHRFISYCITQCNVINEMLPGASDMEKKNLEADKKQYLEIARIMNGGIDVKYEDFDPTKQEIGIKEGTLIIPRDWILLNPDQADEYPFALCVECRHSAELGIPHFVYLTEKKYPYDCTPGDFNKIDSLCVQKWPDFKDILGQQVDPIYNPDDPTDLLNKKEYLAAPTIGYYPILRDDDPLYGDPYSSLSALARIIKTKETK